MNEELRSQIEALEQRARQLAAERREARQARLASLQEAVCWMLLVPVWTEPLARACAFPPASSWEDGGSSLPAPERSHAHRAPHVLAWLRAEGLASSRLVHEGEDPPREEFWMPPDVRHRVLDQLLHKDSSILEHLRQECHHIARRLSSLELPLPEPTRRWARLASAGSDSRQLASALAARVEELLGPASQLPTGSRMDTEERTAEALGWVLTARHLEPLFGPRLSEATAAAERRIDFFQLRLDDERRLHGYVEREEQLAAFRALATSPEDDSAWALHYVGKGGLGKTMLVRHLCTRVLSASPECRPEQVHGYWSRVDFDHLNPAYPTQAPWLLVEQLAEQLRLQAPNSQVTSGMEWFDDVRQGVRELAGTVRSSWQALREEPQWQRLVQSFASVVRGFRGRVFLFFDTCEELAKVTAGEVPANVAATFHLLEELHREAPGLRVLFFGRRPLASRGQGWRLADAPAWLPERPYLRLHEVQSFSRAEAERCYEQVAEVARRPERAALREAVLAKALEVSAPSPFTCEAQVSQPGPRFSPFEVALGAAWIRSDPRVTPELVAEPGTDRYVEMRIVERLPDEGLRALLPAVALLGRFDAAMLQSVWAGAPEPFERALRELSRQEWVRREGRYLQVDEGLQPRLVRYYRGRQPERWRALCEQVSQWLEHYTLEAALEEVQSFHHVALAWLLREEPERGVRWWQQVEERVVRERGYEAAGSVCSELLADGGPLPPEGPAEVAALRARVLATYAASLVHEGRPARSAWEEVERLAPEADTRLRARALLGQLAAARALHEPLAHERVERLGALLEQGRLEWDEQLLGALAGGLHAVVEEVEDSGRREWLRPELLRQVEAWCARASEPLAAFLRATVARAALLAGHAEKGREGLAEAMRRVPLGPTPVQWLDWRSPQDVGARVRLELLRALYPQVLSAREVRRLWCSGEGRGLLQQWAHVDTRSLDQDRLCSALLQLEGALHPAAGLCSSLEDKGWKPAPHGMPTCNAHRAYPPSRVAWAQARGEAGEVAGALERLQEAQQQEEQPGGSARGAAQALEARLGLALRMRALDVALDVKKLGYGSALETDYERAAPVLAMLGLLWADTAERLQEHMPSGELSRWWVHARWRSLPVLGPLQAAPGLAWAASHLRPPAEAPRDFWECSLRLDAREADLVAQRFGLASPFGLKEFAVPSLKQAPLQRLRLLLRAEVLVSQEAAQQLPALVEQVGTRAAAQVALEEGELLALRLPQQGAHLLERAQRLYRESDDPAGALLAGIAWALALAQVPGADLSAVIEGVRRVYAPLLGSRLAWGQLERMAREPSEEGRRQLEQVTGWTEVLTRLVAVLHVWQLRSGLAPQAGPAVLAMGALLGADERLPTELRALGLAEQGNTSRSHPGQTSQVVVQTAAGRSQGAAQSTPGWLWLVALAGLVYALIQFESLRSPRVLLSVLGMLLALGGAAYLARRWRERALAGPLPPPLPMGLLGFLTGLGHKRLEALRALPYKALVGEPGLELGRRLGRSQWKGGVLELTLRPEQAWLCWEAVYGLALMGLQREAVRLTDLRRNGADHYKISALKVWPLHSFSMLAGTDFTDKELLQGYWQPREVDFWDERTAGRVHLLHVLASPSQGPEGPRLKLKVGSALTRVHTTPGPLLSAADLLMRSHGLRVCILQGPLLNRLEREDSDRLRAAAARAFAAELMDAGKLTAVLVVPSLPEDLAHKALQPVAEALMSERWTEALPGAVVALRTTIFDTLGGTEDAFELAMDVCLYMAPRGLMKA